MLLLFYKYGPFCPSLSTDSAELLLLPSSIIVAWFFIIDEMREFLYVVAAAAFVVNKYD